MASPIRIGLALSGGVAKSVCHIGVIKALEEAGIEIVRMTATSGGSVVASYYAAGLPTEQIVERALRTKITDLGGLGFRRLGFLNSEKLYQLVTDAIGEIRFDQLAVPLGIVVANLLTGEEEVIEEGIVARAAQASSCIPQVYTPVEMNGSLYVDGGLLEYLPTRALARYDPPLLVGVNLGYHRELGRPAHMLALIMQTMGIVAQWNARISEQYADVVVKPDLRGFASFEIKEAESMIQVGYEAAQRRIPDIVRAWERRHTTRGRLLERWDRLRGRPTLARIDPVV